MPPLGGPGVCGSSRGRTHDRLASRNPCGQDHTRAAVSMEPRATSRAAAQSVKGVAAATLAETVRRRCALQMGRRRKAATFRRRSQRRGHCTPKASHGFPWRGTGRHRLPSSGNHGGLANQLLAYRSSERIRSVAVWRAGGAGFYAVAHTRQRRDASARLSGNGVQAVRRGSPRACSGGADHPDLGGATRGVPLSEGRVATLNAEALGTLSAVPAPRLV